MGTLTWRWLDDGVLPLLTAIVRACWIWPWLGLIQLGLVPGIPAAALPLMLVIFLPLISFTLASQAARRETPPLDAQFPFQEQKNKDVGWSARFFVALLGFGATLLITWWQLYSVEFSLFSAQWLALLGDSLIHWPENFVPPAVLLILTILGLWLRGLLDAGNAATHDTIWSSVVFGVVMMVLYLLAISSSEVDRVSQLVTSVLVMLAAGMGALAFSSLKITAGLDRALGFGERELGTNRAAVQTPTTPMVNRYWFMSVGGMIGLLLGGGILLALLIAPETLSALLDLIWSVAGFIGDLVMQVVLFVVYVFAYIFFWIYQLIEPLIQRLLENMNFNGQFFEEMGQRLDEATTPTQIEPTPISDQVRWTGLAIFAAITLLIFALVIRRLNATATEESDEVRESILSTDLLQDQLSNLWDRLMGRFRAKDLANPFLALDGEETRQRIRAVYQQLLMTAEAIGQPRRPHLTPAEYRQTLASTTSAQTEEPDSSLAALTEATERIIQLTGAAFAPQLQRITQGYMAARYGDVPPPDSLAQEVEAAWAEIVASVEVDGDPA